MAGIHYVPSMQCSCYILQVLVMLSFSGIICTLQEKLVYIYCVEKSDLCIPVIFITAISAARLILCGHKHDHVTPFLKELHWLPMEQRITFKILLLTFKALNNFCPSYISDLLETYKPTTCRSLRSMSRNLLVIPRSKLKSYGNHAFSVSAPKLWNDIPEIIKCSVDLNAFKRNLKTDLF